MEEESDNNRKKNVKVQMLAEQEIVLLRQQILALRRALGDSEKEAGEMRKKLDKEVSLKPVLDLDWNIISIDLDMQYYARTIGLHICNWEIEPTNVGNWEPLV